MKVRLYKALQRASLLAEAWAADNSVKGTSEEGSVGFPHRCVLQVRADCSMVTLIPSRSHTSKTSVIRTANRKLH